MNHKEWVRNEYDQWIKALDESTVNNFKEHPVVKRMLGEPDDKYYGGFLWGPQFNKTLLDIDRIGREKEFGFYNTTLKRYVSYAFKVLELNPSHIMEIGGGVGEFYAILRALGYKGSYYIMDIAEVQRFQELYLAEVEKQTGLNLEQSFNGFDLVVSFYALGEFDDETKESYRSLISSIPHGYIAWNPHSGATDDLTLFKHDIKVTPGVEPGVKIIQW